MHVFKGDTDIFTKKHWTALINIRQSTLILKFIKVIYSFADIKSYTTPRYFDMDRQ